MKRYLRQCKQCGEPFRTNLSKQVFCSRSCAARFTHESKRAKSPLWHADISTSLVGITSDLLVMLDLIKRGYEPCRPLRSNAPYDILVENNGRAVRIEVRTAHRREDGLISCSTTGDYDMIAKVIQEENDLIVYDPDILPSRTRF